MSNDIQLAWSLVDKFHAGQLYGKKPYRSHLEEVHDSVAEGTTDDRLGVVSILHDILEDTTCTESTLRWLFEDNVVDAVVAITKKPLQTQADYLAQVKGNQMARRVKMHDSFCNMRASLMRFDAKRVKKYAAVIAYLVED